LENIEDDKRLISFDVISLFIKVLVELAKRIAMERLTNDDTLMDRSELDSGKHRIGA